MLKGFRKEYNILKDTTLNLKGYTSIFIHNLGDATVSFGSYEIDPSFKHTIDTGAAAVNENIEVVFEKSGASDTRLYVSVVSVNCN